MTFGTNNSEVIQRIIADNLPLAEEKAAVERLAQRDSQLAATLLTVLVQQKHRHKAATEEGRKAVDELIEKLKQAPWHPATFLRFVAGKKDRALVTTDRGRLVTVLSPDLDAETLRCGSGILLNREQNMLLEITPEMPQSGLVGSFSRFHDGRIVIRGAAGEECVVEAAAGLRERLKSGDLLLYNPESHIAWEAVEKPDEQEYLLEETPDVTFDDIGGLDEVIEEIVDEVTLHFFHPELVRQHRLQPAKGILLCGPPGVGKTMIAKAMANHLSRLHGVEAKFFNVRPGVHRSMWYGKTEENVRQLFARARQAAAGENCLAFLHFDDVDHLGARGDGVSTAIDSRVLPAFLHEIDGLEALNRVALIGSTNRPDLLDEALLRSGRFGDKVFRIPRPSREAAREIFRKHLSPELPFHTNGKGGAAAAEQMIEAALSAIYAPNGENHTLATLTFRDGSRKPLTAEQVMSGALIGNAVREAKGRSCRRAMKNGAAGIAAADLLAALDRQLSGIAQRLKPGAALQQMLDLPQDLDVVKVEAHARMQEKSYEYLSLQ